MMAKSLKIADHDLLRVLDTLDRNGPMTFDEICREAGITSLVVNNGLYTEDELGPPFNKERMDGILYKITKLGKAIIRDLRFVENGDASRTMPEFTDELPAVGSRFRRIDGDEAGRESEPPGSECTVTAHTHGMVWYRYDEQKKRWGRCSKPLCMRPSRFFATFEAV